MPWTEVSPGRFEKPLDTSEAFFWHLNAAPKPPNRERWACCSVSTFETTRSTEEVAKLARQAMKVMRYQHPAIGATLEKDKKVYVVPSESEAESWLDEVVVVEPIGADVNAMFGDYKPTHLMRLHYYPGTSEIMIRTSHWRTDGVGFATFTEDLFSAMADPYDVVFGDEPKRLPSSLEELAENCEITQEKQAKIVQKWGTIMAAGRSYGLPIKLGVPGGTFRQTQLLSPQLTSKIISACKDRKVSFTVAIAASLVGVVKNHHPDEGGDEPTKYITFPFMNLRPYLADKYSSKEHPFTVLVVNDFMMVDVKDFDSNAKQIAPFYSKALDLEAGKETLSLTSTWLQSSIKLLNPPPPPAKPADGKAQAPAAPPQPARPLVSTPALNSLGVLDRQIKIKYEGKNNFEITDFWFGVEILGANMIVYAWTFRGRMRLSIYYNEAFYEISYVKTILQALVDTLLHDLEIPWTQEAKL